MGWLHCTLQEIYILGIDPSLFPRILQCISQRACEAVLFSHLPWNPRTGGSKPKASSLPQAPVVSSVHEQECHLPFTYLWVLGWFRTREEEKEGRGERIERRLRFQIILVYKRQNLDSQIQNKHIIINEETGKML